MKNIEEQLESIEEVIQQLIEKTGEIEKAIGSLPGSIPKPDFSWDFLEIKEQIGLVASALDQARVLKALMLLEQKVASISSASVVRHYHVDTKSKAFIFSAVAAFFITALSFGFALYSWQEQKLLKGNSIKYRMISQQYPKASFWADTTFQRAPDKAEEWVDELEIEQRELGRMEALTKSQQVLLEKNRQQERRLKESISR